jgi:uncharacterized membrane protein YbhN (UPF0104 family)
MKKILSVIVQYVIFLGLGIFLIWWTTKNLTEDEIHQLKEALRGAHYLLVIPAMVMLMLSHYSRALRWKILMEPLRIRPTTANTFFAVMLGYFFNLLVPRLGEVVKCTTLARYEKAPVDKVIGTMVAERAIDFLCLVAVILVTVLLQTDIAGPYVMGELRKAYASKGGASGYLGALLILLALGVVFFIFRWISRKFSGNKIVARVRAMVLGVWQGLTSVRQVQRKAAFIGHTIFIWTMYLMSIRLGFLAMESVAHLGLRPSMTILSTGSLAMIVTQGGIGAYQLAVQKSLALYGIDAVNGLAYGWLLWAVQTVMVLVAGLVCLLILPIYNRKKHESFQPDTGENS